MKRTGFFVLVAALVTVLAFSIVTPARVQAQAEPETSFQFDCEAAGCIYDWGQAIFAPGQRVYREEFVYPGDAVRNMFWPQIMGAQFTDYNVSWEVVKVDRSTNTGVVKFFLNKPARDFTFTHYLHVVWAP